MAIFDATNSTYDRRQQLLTRARAENSSLLFVESICDDEVHTELDRISQNSRVQKSTVKDKTELITKYNGTKHSSM